MKNYDLQKMQELLQHFYNLTSVDFGRVLSIPETDFAKTKISEVRIPASVEAVEERAFYGCKSLEVLNIPANVVFLGNNCFEGAESLREVYISGDRVLEIGHKAFSEAKSELKIYVPADLVDDYKRNILWATYVNNLYAMAE